MTRSTWSDYDAWEARDRTFLEAAAIARAPQWSRALLDDPRISWECSTCGLVSSDPGECPYCAARALDREHPVRYRSPSPAEELPLDL